LEDAGSTPVAGIEGPMTDYYIRLTPDGREYRLHEFRDRHQNRGDDGAGE